MDARPGRPYTNYLKMSELTQNRGQGMLMVARITVEAAAAFFITASLLNYGVACSRLGAEFAAVQLVPAAAALALPVVAFWVAVTLVFGRVYCSTVCPVGALTDLASRMRPRRKVYRYARGATWVRVGAFAVITLLLACRIGFARQWLEPYGLYASIVETLTAPRVGVATAMGAVATAAIALAGYRRGRLLCNTLCPVGAALGFMSRRAAFHIDIDTDRCIQCRRCADVCKAQCIDLESHTADMSRCVVCFNCLPECPNEAIAYTMRRHTLSDPLLQKIKSLKTPEIASTCDNTSTSCKTFSKTEPSKPTEQARGR